MPCEVRIDAEALEGPVVVKRAMGADAPRLRAEGDRLLAAAHPGVVRVLASTGDDDRWELRLAHGGRPLYMPEAFFILRRHRQVWLDLSGIPPRSILEYFPRIEEIGSRVVWGTDWPSPGVSSMRKNVDEFLALPLSEGFRRGVVQDNPERLLP